MALCKFFFNILVICSKGLRRFHYDFKFYYITKLDRLITIYKEPNISLLYLHNNIILSVFGLVYLMNKIYLNIYITMVSY